MVFLHCRGQKNSGLQRFFCSAGGTEGMNVSTLKKKINHSTFLSKMASAFKPLIFCPKSLLP